MVILKMAPAPTVQVINISQAAGISIFMADVPDALQDFKERITAEAQHQKVAVANDIPPPMPMPSAKHWIGRGFPFTC